MTVCFLKKINLFNQISTKSNIFTSCENANFGFLLKHYLCLETDKYYFYFTNASQYFTGKHKKITTCIMLQKIFFADCGIPAKPQNGEISVDNTTLGSFANISCDPGYKLNDTSPIKCEASGNWSSLSYSCERLGNK